MDELSLQDTRSTSKSEKDDKITYNNIRTNCGICCICRKPPVHSKNYYGHVFCTDCFYKYIFSKNECSGDVVKKEKDTKEDKKEAIEVKKEAIEVKKEGIEVKKEGIEVKKEGIEVKKEGIEVKKEGIEVKREMKDIAVKVAK